MQFTPERIRIPAQEMLHLFMPDRVGQCIGVPWLVSTMTRLQHLHGYEEAELIAARCAASKMGFIEKQSSDGYAGPSDGAGSKEMRMEPGAIEELLIGQSFKPFDPSHPNTAFGEFLKGTLRGIASGLGISYVTLANDLEGTSYSSVRAGLIDERQEWKAIQQWFIEWLVRPVFEEWLANALAFGAISGGANPLPASRFNKFNSPEFKPRRWEWVDPLKDMQANVLAVNQGFKSRRALVAEQGGDIEDTFGELAADDALAKSYGLKFEAEDQSANAASDEPDAAGDAKPGKGKLTAKE